MKRILNLTRIGLVLMLMAAPISLVLPAMVFFLIAVAMVELMVDGFL